MPTLVNLEYVESELFIFFTEKIVALEKYESGSIDAGLYVLDDGFVYYYDTVFAFANKSNNVYEVIITDKNKLGMVLIDTKQASKTHKQLIRKLEEFLALLNTRMVELSKGNEVNITLYGDRLVEEIKEEIVIQHAV